MAKNLFSALFSTFYRGNISDFESMGRGIEARYARCRNWWDSHLEYSRRFIIDSIPPSERVLVIGAGRLLDIDLALLQERSREIHLLDADRGCVVAWEKQAGKAFGSSVIGVIKDCTDVMEEWSRGLSRLKGNEARAHYLRTCRAAPPQWSAEHYDGVISLNVLGQIPLYWRDRVVGGRASLCQEESTALEMSMGELQSAHIQAVRAQGRMWSLVITDTEYYFYHADRSQWRVEPALYGESSRLLMEEYGQCSAKERWFWHVSPQFIECDDEGEIHRVEAFYRPSREKQDRIRRTSQV